MTDEELRIAHPTTTIRPGSEYKSGRFSVDDGYKCPCCGAFRSWSEGETECKNCGAFLKPVIEIQGHGVDCNHED